jgi:hypothetical protein
MNEPRIQRIHRELMKIMAADERSPTLSQMIDFVIAGAEHAGRSAGIVRGHGVLDPQTGARADRMATDTKTTPSSNRFTPSLMGSVSQPGATRARCGWSRKLIDRWFVETSVPT